MSSRGGCIATLAAVGGALAGGLSTIILAGLLGPEVEVTPGWLLAPAGTEGSLLLVGAGLGLFVGCAVGLRIADHPSPWVTAALVLAVLPFAMPLVRLAGQVGAWAAAVVGLLVVGGAVTGAGWLTARCASDRVRGEAVSGAGRR